MNAFFHLLILYQSKNIITFAPKHVYIHSLYTIING